MLGHLAHFQNFAIPKNNIVNVPVHGSLCACVSPHALLSIDKLSPHI